MVVEHAIVIERPREELWDLFADPDHLVQWQSALVSYQQIEGEPGVTGSVSKQTIERGGAQIDLTATILDAREPEFMKVEYEGLQLPFTISNTFSAVDGDTTEWHAVIDVRLNMLQKALGPVIKGPLTDLAEQNGEDFKRYAERR